MRKKVTTLLLALVMLFSLTIPALADKIDVSQMPGHEVLVKLPDTLQRPVRPTTLEQAEGRIAGRMISIRLEEEKKQAYRDQYGYWYDTPAEMEEEIAKQFSGGSYPVRWTLDQSKESVFQEIVKLTDSLTAGKTTDTEKAKAIFDWVSQNIKYDYTAYQYHVWQDKGYGLTEAQKAQIDRAADPFYAYAQRLAICDGYSDLSWLMLSIAEIPAVRISGDSNERGLNGGGPHAWNAVLLDGKWLFFDTTWKMWDIAPNYHKTSVAIAFCDGVFQQTTYLDTLDNSFPVSYWLCPGFECPANVVMPEGCWDVMAESFKYCTTLKHITLPSTCTIIQTEAFKGCTGLESITIPANVTQVNWRAFQGCTSLKSVTFGNKAVDVWEDAFDGTPLVEDAKEFAIVGGVLIKYKGNAREVTIPSGVTAIAEKAFSCSDHAKFYVKKVVIPGGVISIGRNAFSNCRVLTDVTIPKSVTDIGGSAFSGTPWLKNQGDWPVFGGILLAYQGEDMESLTVPDGVREISDYAFYYNGKKTRSITFPASLTKIGQWAFNHSYLEEVVFKGNEKQWAAVEIVPDGGTNWRFRNVVDPDEQATVRCTGAYAASPTNDKLTVDGASAAPTAYKIDGANYFKLRDVAALLNGSASQFNVDYDAAAKSVVITTGKGYEILDTDLQPAPAGTKAATASNNAVYIDGVKVELTIYKINGANYFKLRDLGQELDFYVGWTRERGVFIESDKPYDPVS